ncbi:MAG: ATP-binding cassette domain-containing protein [Actinomycetaceae bacterium]|nr:ATP-binding cassette domain-containing protein [Actinomycetaceae bacterium]
MMAMLRAERVVVTRGRGGLRKPMSFSLAEGQALIVRGGDGSGKTTLLKAIAGIVNHGGIITYCQSDSGQPCSLDERRQACGVSLETLFWPGYTVSQTLVNQCWLYGIKGDINAILKQLDIVYLSEQSTEVLSTGESMRLSVARALVTSPSILILDEPERGLDSQSFTIISEAIRVFLASGGIAVVATHLADWQIDAPIVVDCGSVEKG